MREIKVRGYAIEEMIGSQWMYGTGIHITEFTDEYFEKTGVKEECFVWTDMGWEHVHKDSIAQYTGLKDKNGREIYEGDIVIGLRSSHWHEGYDKVRAIVIFRTETASFDVDSSKYKTLMNGGSLHNIDELEIIGNIHENSELLGDDK